MFVAHLRQLEGGRKIICDIFFQAVELDREEPHFIANMTEQAISVHQTAETECGGNSVRCSEVYRCRPFEEVRSEHDEEVEGKFNKSRLVTYANIKRFFHLLFISAVTPTIMEVTLSPIIELATAHLQEEGEPLKVLYYGNIK